VVAERLISEKIHEQRAVLSNTLDAGLHAVLHAAQVSGRNKIQQAYRLLLDETKDREATWQKSRLTAISSIVPGSEMEQANVSETLGQVDTLMRDIRAIRKELEE
jgi:hypothetical protein